MLSEQDTTDEQLIEQFIAGDVEAFEDLVRRYYRHIYRFIARFAGRTDIAEDLTQEVFTKVYKAGATFDLQRRFKPWLFSIAANTTRDAIRARSRTVKTVSMQAGTTDQQQGLIDTLPGDQPDPHGLLVEQETAANVKSAVDSLPEQLREVLILAYYERLAYKEIAEALAIPLGTVKSRLHKAVLAFGDIWKASDRHEQQGT